MKLGDRSGEFSGIWHFIYDMDEVGEEEVNVGIRSIGTPSDGSGSCFWDELVQDCHGYEFPRHHGFSDVALGYPLVISLSVLKTLDNNL